MSKMASAKVKVKQGIIMELSGYHGNQNAVKFEEKKGD